MVAAGKLREITGWSKMVLEPNVGKVAIAFFILANAVLDAQRTYKLTGTTNFRVQGGDEITVTGYYKYCQQSIYCPSCVRQVYLNLFTRSVCLASLVQSDLDCKEHHFSKKFTAPNTGGNYDIKMEEKLAFKCVANRVSSSGGIVGTVVVQERRPILQQNVLVHNTEDLLQNDSVTFTVFLTHAYLSRDHAWNTVLVWILPYYARFLSHVPKTNITSPYPGEYQIGIGKIELKSSIEINITVQLDPESNLSVGGHFVSIPTYVVYEKHIPGDATKVFAGSVESVTVNFTVREGTPRGFIMHPLSNDVYFCKTKTSDSNSSCYFSTDGQKWTGIDPRVKFISGMIVRGLRKQIFATTSDDQCHVVSEDGHAWSCIVSEEWQRESSSDDFVHAISVPRDIKSDIPQDGFVFSKNDSTVSYGGSAKGLHKKENNGAWHLVASWDCP